MNRQQHWNQIYQSKKPEDMSWYQVRPEFSLSLITSSGVSKDVGIIDVGGGASTLVDCLLDAGYTDLAVLDLSGIALAHGRTRLGVKASLVEWFEADVTSFKLPHCFGLWHDRAVFHFLINANDRRGYVETLQQTLLPGSTAIVATFALDGPSKCSGLDVMRYDEQSIVDELGTEFTLQEARRETHITPWKSKQSFVYFRFLRQAHQ